MLSARIIPCLDVAGGRVVKGINFVELQDAGDPVEQAAAYDAQGADELCFLDISASPGGHDTMIEVVRQTAETIFIPLTVGGGVRKVEDAKRLLDAGADKVAVNTAAIATPGLIDELAANGEVWSDKFIEMEDSARRSAAIGTVLMVGGIAAMVGGGVSYYLGHQKGKEARSRTTSLRVTPTLSLEGKGARAGIGMGWSF